MKILVDTSAWVDFLNGHLSPEGRELATLIAGEHDLCTCGIVVAEVFQGLRREKERQEIDTPFRHLTFLEPASVDAYFRAAALGQDRHELPRTIRAVPRSWPHADRDREGVLCYLRSSAQASPP